MHDTWTTGGIIHGIRPVCNCEYDNKDEKKGPEVLMCVSRHPVITGIRLLSINPLSRKEILAQLKANLRPRIRR